MKNNRPLILVTNDDGTNAKGIKELTKLVSKYGDVIVVAPEVGQSGMSHAITIKSPIILTKLLPSNGISGYSCNGTPVDCVKLSLNQILERKPNLIVSGINHGSNSSISVVYSGTMGAAIEGCVNGIPSIGLSILDFNPDADFSVAIKYAEPIIKNVLKNGLPENTCLNVNFPLTEIENVQGIKICRQTKGVWKEEFVKRTDPHNRDYFWLTGSFKNHEPNSEDTDEWALKNNYVSIVPVCIDLTSYKAINILNKWEYEV